MKVKEPFEGAWKWFVFVVLWLLFLIVLFYLITRYFS